MDTREKLIEALRKLARWPEERWAEVLARVRARLAKLDKREEADDGRDDTTGV